MRVGRQPYPTRLLCFEDATPTAPPRAPRSRLPRSSIAAAAFVRRCGRTAAWRGPRARPGLEFWRTIPRAHRIARPMSSGEAPPATRPTCETALRCGRPLRSRRRWPSAGGRSFAPWRRRRCPRSQTHAVARPDRGPSGRCAHSDHSAGRHSSAHRRFQTATTPSTSPRPPVHPAHSARRPGR